MTKWTGKSQSVRSVGLPLHLYNACVPPTGSYGCEVWGLQLLPANVSHKSRDALGSSRIQILGALATIPKSVIVAVLLCWSLANDHSLNCGGSRLSPFGIACVISRAIACIDRWL